MSSSVHQIYFYFYFPCSLIAAQSKMCLTCTTTLRFNFSALPRIKIINCQVHVNIFLMTQGASEKLRQQYAFIQAGIGSFTISLPEIIENETEITEQGEVKTQPMVVRHFKLADGGFWIKIHKTRDNVNASSSKSRLHKRSPSSRTFFHTAESLCTFANSTSNSLWARDRWDAATASYSNAASTSFPMIYFFKCPSLQMSTKWEYALFRIINGTIEEYIYEHTIDYPMLFDYQSIQQNSSTMEEKVYDRHHQEQHGSGMIIRLSVTKHVEFNVDKDVLDVIGVLVTAASDTNKAKNEEKDNPSPLPQTSSRRLILGVNNDTRDQNRLELKGTTGASQSCNCTIDLQVSKIVLRIQQCPLTDTASRCSSFYSFCFWSFNVNSLSYKLNLRLKNCRETEVVVTMECIVRKIALNKFIGAQPKQMLFTVEGFGAVDSTLPIPSRNDPWDNRSTGSNQHNNNTNEAAINTMLWFAIPSTSNKFASSTNNSTAMHLSVLVGSVAASLSSVSLQELSETFGDVQRRLFPVKEVGHHRVVRRQHQEYSVRRPRKVEQDRLERIKINYDMKIGCASVLWDEKIQMKLDSAFVRGCKTYPDGDSVQMFLKSLLDSITIEIGSARCSEKGISLGSLPDGVRMLVLLYVGDETTGLEQALNVPPDSNRLMHMINLNQRLSLI